MAMFYDGPITYKQIQGSKFIRDKPYYVSYMNGSVLESVKVFTQSTHEKTSYNISPNFYLKLNLPVLTNKWIYRIFRIKKIKYVLLDQYIPEEYIREDDFASKVAYLNIRSKMSDEIDAYIDAFAIKYPDVYLSKIQNYNGFRSSSSPHYEEFLRNNLN